MVVVAVKCHERKGVMKRYRVGMFMTVQRRTGPILAQVYSHRLKLIQKLLGLGEIARTKGGFVFQSCLRKA